LLGGDESILKEVSALSRREMAGSRSLMVALAQCSETPMGAVACVATAAGTGVFDRQQETAVHVGEEPAKRFAQQLALDTDALARQTVNGLRMAPMSAIASTARCQFAENTKLVYIRSSISR
jgi:hypothetical protein